MRVYLFVLYVYARTEHRRPYSYVRNAERNAGHKYASQR
jgi:hypothetical protein